MTGCFFPLRKKKSESAEYQFSYQINFVLRITTCADLWISFLTQTINQMQVKSPSSRCFFSYLLHFPPSLIYLHLSVTFTFLLAIDMNNIGSNFLKVTVSSHAVFSNSENYLLGFLNFPTEHKLLLMKMRSYAECYRTQVEWRDNTSYFLLWLGQWQCVSLFFSVTEMRAKTLLCCSGWIKFCSHFSGHSVYMEH